MSAIVEEIRVCDDCGEEFTGDEGACCPTCGSLHGHGTGERAVVELPPEADLEAEDDEPRCRVCGCTANNPCPGGCFWYAEDLCSACVPDVQTCNEWDGEEFGGPVLSYWCKGHVRPDVFAEVLLAEWDREVLESDVEHTYARLVPARDGVGMFFHAPVKPGPGAFKVTLCDAYLPPSRRARAEVQHGQQ